MASSPPERLSAHDSVFLNWERPEQPMHVAECMVYDGHITAADIVRMIGDRMHLLPRYRQKIVPAPFGIAHPTWEDDPDFDVANHVDEQTLPSPGDDRVLSRVCGELYCRLLERARPLWHLTVLHGDAGGGTVIFLKLHHAMVDGVSSVELIEVLHSTERGTPPPPPPASGWQPRPVPGRVERLRHVVADEVAHTLGGLREVGDLVRPGAFGSLAKRVRALTRAAVDTGPLLVRPLPPTPFNAPIHPKRDFAWVELPLAEVKAVRAALGGTINDLVLAVLSGGLARYMARHGVDPDGRQLEALCPVSVRGQDQSGAMGNLISMVVAPLYVGIPDGAERLAAEREAVTAAIRQLRLTPVLFELGARPPEKKNPGEEFKKRTGLKFTSIDVLNVSIGKFKYIDLGNQKNSHEQQIGIEDWPMPSVKSEADLAGLGTFIYLRSDGFFDSLVDRKNSGSDILKLFGL